MGDDETKEEKPRTKERGDGFTEISLGGEQEQKPVEPGEEKPGPRPQPQEPEPTPVTREPAPSEKPLEAPPERRVPEILEVRRPEEPRPEPEARPPSEPVEPTPTEPIKPKLEVSDLIRQKQEDASKDVLPTQPKPFQPLQLPRRKEPEDQAAPPESPSELHKRVYGQVQTGQEDQPGLLERAKGRVKKLFGLG